MADDELMRDFLIECHEGLDKLDNDFLALEQDPDDRERLAAIFRAIHTIKGNSGFLGLGKLQGIAHAGENLLALLRDGKLRLTPEIANALLSLVDAIRQILAALEAGQGEGDVDYSVLSATLTAYANGARAPAGQAERIVGGEHRAASPPSAALDPRPPPSGGPPAPAPAAATTASAPQRGSGEVGSGSRIALRPAAEAGAKRAESDLADSTIRVDVKLLDRLMNLVGELVLTRNQVMQHVGRTASQSAADGALQSMAGRLDQLTSELQEGVMKTRMQPISTLWGRLPRMVRDLAGTVGKQIRVEMEGQGTELDKSVLEAIKDPLTHIVRNAIDHGIERPDRRLAAGKPAEGCLRLRAGHEGGHVIIAISDDGGGIDHQRVAAKAVERKLITAEAAARLTQEEAIRLIFLPGFSTAEQVTNISGRGVGMDVVKTNIERIGGRVDLVSQPGQGANLTMTIPLTLAIIPALVVATGGGGKGPGERFCIPQSGLRELVRVDAGAADAIEEICGARFHRLRGQLLPLVELNKALGLDEDPAVDAVNIAVLQIDGVRFGVVVDAINDSEEIVVKPLSRQLKGIGLYAGSTIMGDGRVALILDVGGLSRQANLSEGAKRAMEESRRFARDGKTTSTLLLFQSPDGGRMALPLDSVARLEELPADRIESIAGREMIQYRGGILPLVRLQPAAGAGAGGMAQVIVHVRRERRTGAAKPIGLIVGQIIDTVEHAREATRTASRPGVLGCVVVAGKVTELLDIEHAIRGAWPDYLDDTEPLADGGPAAASAPPGMPARGRALSPAAGIRR